VILFIDFFKLKAIRKNKKPLTRVYSTSAAQRLQKFKENSFKRTLSTGDQSSVSDVLSESDTSAADLILDLSTFEDTEINRKNLKVFQTLHHHLLKLPYFQNRGNLHSHELYRFRSCKNRRGHFVMVLIVTIFYSYSLQRQLHVMNGSGKARVNGDYHDSESMVALINGDEEFEKPSDYGSPRENLAKSTKAKNKKPLTRVYSTSAAQRLVKLKELLLDTPVGVLDPKLRKELVGVFDVLDEPQFIN
jgi:hypothetical protein